MAGRRGRGAGSVSRATRVASDPTSTLTWLRTLSAPLRDPTALFQPLDDGRYWHPDPDQGALTIGGRYARVIVHQRPLVARSKALSSWIGGKGLPIGLQVPVGVKFESPYRVLTCVRRKVRRAVVFARGKAGKGVKKRRPRRTWRSNVVC